MIRIAGLALALSCLGWDPAIAGELAPGEGGTEFEDYGIYPMPPESEYRGELLAERSEPFTFEAVDEGEPVFVGGTFTSRVYRDAGTGGLAFLYLLDGSGNNVHDLESLRQVGFGGGPLDVYTDIDDFGVQRSADGDRLDWGFNREGLNVEFLVRTGQGPYALVQDGFDVTIDFEPGGRSAGGDFDAYAPVPEPSGAAVLAAAFAVLLRRSRRPH